jgi:hypothetical protein
MESGRGSPDRSSHWTRSPNGAATLVKAATRLALLSSCRALLAAQAAASRSYSGSSLRRTSAAIRYASLDSDTFMLVLGASPSR